MLQRMAAPPRRVPLSLRIVSLFNGAVQIGFAIVGFGSLFVWAFLPNTDLRSSTAHFTGAARGYVTSVTNTRAKQNRQRILANAYTFSVAGRQFTGTSYSDGEVFKPGDAVTVEYDESNPMSSQIQGMRRNMFGAGTLVTLIFPAVGLGIVAVGIWYGLTLIRGLRDYEIAKGKVVNRQYVVASRGRTVVTYEFQSVDGATYQSAVRLYDQSQIAQDEALLLYDRNRPDRAERLPTAVQSVEGPAQLAGRPAAAIGALILPALVIAANIIAAHYLL